MRGIIITKVGARSLESLKDMIKQKIRVRGERIAILIVIWKAICTAWTSVVIRVIREPDLNFSMFSKEKSVMFLNMEALMFLARPLDAFVAR